MEGLASAVEAVTRVEVSALPDAVLVEELLELTVLGERLAAARLARLAELDGRGIGLAEHGGSTVAWLSEATRCAPWVAARQVRLARDLGGLPVTAAALGEGRVSVDHARVIAGLRREVLPEVVAAAEPALVAAAGEVDPHQLKAWTAQVRHAHAAERVRLDERAAYDAREVQAGSSAQGSGLGRWSLPAALQETVLTALSVFSAPVPGDDRTARQRRADALVTIAELALRSAEAPQSRGARPAVSVLVPLATLEERAGAPAASYGFGATSSGEWARRMSCDAVISRVVVGPRSEPLDVGRASRCFTPAQVRAIVARDRHCRWPGCDRPPAWAEAHHVRHWALGGQTSVDNAVLLCGRHHDRVHAHAHRVVIRPDGTRTIDLTPGSARDDARPPSTGPP